MSEQAAAPLVLWEQEIDSRDRQKDSSWQKAVQSILVFIKLKQRMKKNVNEPNLPTLHD